MLDLQALEPLLRASLAEDVGPGDVTSELMVPPDARGLLRIQAGAPGVLAGLPVATALLRLAAGGELETLQALDDGAPIESGQCVLEAAGNARGLLGGERTALNFLMRLSGIATLTSRFVALVEGTGASVLDTRKTTPGLRALEKYAVATGGGINHRRGLYDRILVKENHLSFGGDLAGIAGQGAVVEAESLEEFRRAMQAGAAVVMLDNMTPDQIAEACRARGPGPSPAIEVSGGIGLDSVRAYAEAGADRISIGALTHSAPALDFSMRITPISG